MSKPKPTLDRASILGQKTLPTEIVAVPEWSGQVFIRVLTARERDAFETWVSVNKSRDIRAKAVSMMLSDETGKRLCTDADIEALAELSSVVLDRIFEAGIRLNKIGKRDVDELKKNSPEILSVDSSSS